ncbi:MAG TPA: MarR family transcriptional regulator [Streptosporangiaceae bacterium]
MDATTAGAESGAVSGSGAALTGLLRGRLREVSALVEQRGEAALAGTSLSLPLNHLLDAVVAEPGVTVTEIARRLGKSQQAMSQAADRLERLGFIERHVGAGRTVGLHATESGRTASADGVRRELAAEDRTRAILGFDRFDNLVALLESTREALLRDPAGS